MKCRGGFRCFQHFILRIMGPLLLLSEVQCPGRSIKDSSCSLALNSALWSCSLSPDHILVLRNPRKNQAWSLPWFSERQLHKRTWASWAPLTDGGPPHLWQVAVINFWRGHWKKLQKKETRGYNSEAWELKTDFSVSLLLEQSAVLILHHILPPDDKYQCCASFWNYQLWWWKRKISKSGHHLFNHKIIHQMTGSRSDPGFNSPHLHLVIIIRPSVRLIAVKFQWTYSIQAYTQIQTVLPPSLFFCLSVSASFTCTVYI